jgi:hypothetical protein
VSGKTQLLMLAHKRKRQRNQVKGALFEVIVRRLLEKANYDPITPDNKSVRKTDGKVRGRGCWHDIDAFGKLSYPIPYVYPIRLLAEAKCYDGRDQVGLAMVQNFMGALKDISENYFIRDKITRQNLLTYDRYTDCGAIFSASDFTIDAQRFALAHGISLISYQNNPMLRSAVNSMYALMRAVDIALASRRKSDFCKYIYQKLSSRLQRTYRSRFIRSRQNGIFFRDFREFHGSMESIKTSAIAIAIGKDQEVRYPIHVLSYDTIPENIFAESDTHLFRVHYSTSENGLIFRVNPVDTHTQLFFSLPRSIYQDYFARRRMLDFKEKFLRYIEFPIILRELRRIVTFELDTEWVREQRVASSPPARQDYQARNP